MDIHESIDAFLSNRTLRGCTPRTIQTYRTQLSTLLAWTKQAQITNPTDIQSETLGEYLTYLRRKARQHTHQPLSPIFIRKSIIAIKTFLSWCNVPTPIDIPRAPRRLPKSRAPYQVKTLMSTIDNPRDQAIIALMLDSGLRLTEVTLLDTQDVDLTRGTIHVRHGKGDNDRWTLFTPDTAKLIQSWLKQRHSQSNSLFTSRSHNRLSASGLYKAIKRSLKKANVPGHPHCLRHTFATHYLDAGGAIQDLQSLLGHNSIQTTMIYITISLEHLRHRHTQLSFWKDPNCRPARSVLL